MNNHTIQTNAARPAARIAATVGVAFLLATGVGGPASAMLAPFDPAPTVVLDPSQDSTTPFCFMGHPSWPTGVLPRELCTS
jgi:hypothetical protein